MLSPLFSMAPMLKSLTATIMKMSRSYSRPYTSSSHFIDFFRLSMPCCSLPMFSGST
ncbi:hypothetical protein D9M71_766140 [compost metagenome]